MVAGESWGWKVKLFSSSIHPVSLLPFLVVYYLCKKKGRDVGKEGGKGKEGRKRSEIRGQDSRRIERVSGQAAE